MQQTDYYRVLEVDSNADQKQIKEVYRSLAFKYHPDRGHNATASAEKMKAVNEAYAVLSNPTKREAYDRMKQQFGASAHGHFRQNYTERDIFSGSDIGQIFEEMARSFGFRGTDEVFREYYGNGYHTFEFMRGGLRGKSFVFDQQQGMRPPRSHRGMGRLVKYVVEKVSGIELPERGLDIHKTIRIAPEQAANGGPLAYFLKDTSKKLIVQIPPGVQGGQKIRLTGMGGNGKGGGTAGDLYLKVVIKKPLIRRIRDRFNTLTSKDEGKVI